MRKVLQEKPLGQHILWVLLPVGAALATHIFLSVWDVEQNLREKDQHLRYPTGTKYGVIFNGDGVASPFLITPFFVFKHLRRLSKSACQCEAARGWPLRKKNFSTPTAPNYYITTLLHLPSCCVLSLLRSGAPRWRFSRSPSC